MAKSKEDNRYKNLRQLKSEPVELVVLPSDDEGDVKRTGKVVHTPKPNPNPKQKAAPKPYPASKFGQTPKPNPTSKHKPNPTTKVASPKMVSPPSVNLQRPLLCQWRHPVTKAMENLKAKQTMHIPAWVVDVCLKKITSMTVCSAVYFKTYECNVVNPKRGPLVRYLAKGWYEFLADHKPKVGDVLHFFLKTPNVMVVEIIPRPKKRSG